MSQYPKFLGIELTGDTWQDRLIERAFVCLIALPVAFFAVWLALGLILALISSAKYGTGPMPE